MNDCADLIEFLFYRRAKNGLIANAHLAHLQAPAHGLMTKLAKGPNFPRYRFQITTRNIIFWRFFDSQRGIRAFGTGFLMSGNFRIDDAVPASARIAYLATKILLNDLTPITYYEGQDIKDWYVEDPDWNFLNRLKRQPDKSSFYYWYQTFELTKTMTS